MLTKKKQKKSDAILDCLIGFLQHLLLLALLAGCSATATYQSPVTVMPTARPLPLSDGTTLPLSKWSPAEKPQALLLAVHGLNGHRGNFTELGDFMRNHGVALYAYDQRGFGENPNRGEWPGGDLLVSDLVETVQHVAADSPGTALFLLGESLGTTVILPALASHPELPVAGAVLVAPTVMEREAVSPLLRLVVWLGARMFPWLAIPQENSAVPLAKEPGVLEQIRDDPKMIQATRLDTLEAVYQMMYQAISVAPEVMQPVLLIYGGKDHVVPVQAAERLQQLLPTATARYYPEGYHLLLHDVEATNVQQDILTWLSTLAQRGLSRSTSK